MPAFTEAQRVKIRLYLGWSARFHQTDSQLEQAMSAIDQDPDPDTNVMILGLLTNLDSIQTRIIGAYNRLKARTVGSIELPRADEVGVLRSEGRRLVGQLAATLGVEIRHDVFSGTAPNGGNYARHG